VSVSKKLREYFGAPSARLEEMLREVERLEERLADIEVALAIALDEGNQGEEDA